MELALCVDEGEGAWPEVELGVEPFRVFFRPKDLVRLCRKMDISGSSLKRRSKPQNEMQMSRLEREWILVVVHHR